MHGYRNLTVIIDPDGNNHFRDDLTTGQATIYAKSAADVNRGIDALNARGILEPETTEPVKERGLQQ